MTIHIQPSTTAGRASKRHSKPENRTLRDLLEEEDEVHRYSLFALPQSNTAIVCQSVGAVIAAQREAVNLPQATVARKAFITPRRLSAIEAGRSQPTIAVFLSICEAVGIDPRELFSQALERMHYPVGYIPVSNSQPHL